MFTGIIETTGIVADTRSEADNLHITVKSAISNELKIDQSVSHNGVCLTVVELSSDHHVVTAVKETLSKSNIGSLKNGDLINLERCTKVGSRLDGHIVQGHVDQTARCTDICDQNGSWLFTFDYDPSVGNITVEKGSICVNGVSLTVVNSTEHGFSVAIIPYTYDNTNFNQLQVGSEVNLEFDIIGKYVSRLLAQRG